MNSSHPYLRLPRLPPSASSQLPLVVKEAGGDQGALLDSFAALAKIREADDILRRREVLEAVKP